MSRPHAFTKLAPAILCLATAGCGTLRTPQWAEIKPIEVGGSPLAAQDGYYAAAAAAIRDRDYGRALDLLQLARRGREVEPRILNAFGVVYDKLGRFDLSARYYAQALAHDPNSQVIRANLAYSQELQEQWRGRNSAPLPGPTSPLRVASPDGPSSTSPGAPGAQLAGTATANASAVAEPRPAMRRGLVLRDASGEGGRVRQLQAHLRSLGWSAGPVHLDGSLAQRTVIRYPAHQTPQARALARTLPGVAQLESCGRACRVIEVTFGADVRRWRSMSPKSNQTIVKG